MGQGTGLASSQVRGDGNLKRLRFRLTAWYTLTFAVILLLLGGGLFVTLQKQVSAQLDDSLSDAVLELERAATIREMESRAAVDAVDAVEELRIPDRSLYLLTPEGRAIKPDTAAAWISEAARRASMGRPVFAEFQTPADVTLELYAKQFTLGSGARFVAVAVADKVEMEDKYADLITAFAAVAVFAVLLVGAGGWLLMRKSTAPVERSIAHMRRFMADAAHELRTPISVARARAEVALEVPRDAATYEAALRGIAAETIRIGKIVEDLLTLSHADAGEEAIKRAVLYLDDIVVEAAGAAAFLAASRSIELRVDKFEEARIVGDAELLRQLVLILLDNAIKFSPAGSRVSVCVGVVTGFAEMEIEDHGPGIPPEHLPHIFERFFRGDEARTRKDLGSGSIGAQGAGLGLSIAQWITDAHGGSIYVRPVAPSGSRFVVRLPLAPATEGVL